MTPSKTAATRTESAKPPHIIVVRVELTPDAKRESASVADKFGMTQIATLSRLIEWFAGQSDEVQAGILSHYSPEDENDVARQVLSQIATTESSRKG